MGLWQGDDQWQTGKDGVEEDEDRFRIPLKSDVIAPDVNGATLDPNSILDVPLAWNADGSVTCTMTSGVSVTAAKDGWVCILPWRDDDGRIALRPPAQYGAKVMVSTPPAASSGLYIWAGLVDNIAASLGVIFGVDYDGVAPRARVGPVATSGVSAANVLGVGAGGSSSIIPGTGTNRGQSKTVTGALVDAAGAQLSTATKSSALPYNGQTWLAFGCVPHLNNGPHTFTFFPSAFIRQLAAGERT